ncbi:hypothetical protein BRAO375_4900002 [Bradyrhizobium sp. ORS 375]|nr:hypothetical protein BRAO375_4900002 [Bradyrhizobium sp. ORS 375]
MSHSEDAGLGRFRKQLGHLAGSQINGNVPIQVCLIADPKGVPMLIVQPLRNVPALVHGDQDERGNTRFDHVEGNTQCVTFERRIASTAISQLGVRATSARPDF